MIFPEGYVEIEYIVEVRGRETVNRTLLRQARIRYDDVDDTFPGLDRHCNAVYVFEPRKISCDGSDILANHGHRFVQFRLPSRHDEDVRAFFGKPLCRGQADSAIAACDEG